jgi:hypothetical protein
MGHGDGGRKEEGREVVRGTRKRKSERGPEGGRRLRRERERKRRRVDKREDKRAPVEGARVQQRSGECCKEEAEGWMKEQGRTVC